MGPGRREGEREGEGCECDRETMDGERESGEAGKTARAWTVAVGRSRKRSGGGGEVSQSVSLDLESESKHQSVDRAAGRRNGRGVAINLTMDRAGGREGTVLWREEKEEEEGWKKAQTRGRSVRPTARRAV